MVAKCELSEFHGYVTDFGNITNGDIKLNVINEHVRKVLEVVRSRIAHHYYKGCVSMTSTVTVSCGQYVVTHLIRSVLFNNAYTMGDTYVVICKCLTIIFYRHMIHSELQIMFMSMWLPNF